MIQDIDELRVLCALTFFVFTWEKVRKYREQRFFYNIKYRFMNIEFVSTIVCVICRVNFRRSKFFSLNDIRERINFICAASTVMEEKKFFVENYCKIYSPADQQT